ncbi:MULTISPECIES: PepSY domain-containing protein [unclassified Lentimonas]|uniref:PepSY-associated TM helix domain-containing protein n=1 Tax=unclassified Lentimonas TaxID=2630993 RepID=UPI00132AC74A|nr:MULTISPECIES: PepSY-associated TM helix domain-containing protein [unclassified Lentimonas]CAA6677220.1 Unannotated [Lentimonas sp. CC4]CAA6686155.1 Unannotated [Lentimonas sp. CC6]CAA7074187.1 Unannotated [Lentimonas sp. CC4]CAA7171545.1 Unannotated [Lentimonas sp. CC21]CAA7182024.1 Unannotated [Lentimonas sp. CC8]
MKVQGSLFRKTIFWVHLVCGLVAGVVIAIMSATGIAIAFEEEILDWVDREVSHVEVPAEASPLGIAEMLEVLELERPEFDANYVEVPADDGRAFVFLHGRHERLYVNSYTGAIGDSRRAGAHDVIHEIEMWHRFLAFHGEDNYIIGRTINGVSNLAFLGLCLTGLYLWFPKKRSARAIKSILLFKRGAKGKARDYNWHNVFGFWSLPVLVILAATAVVISFEWGHKLVFTLSGEDAPEVRDFRMMAVAPAEVPMPEEGAELLSYEASLVGAQVAFPDWETIGMPLTTAASDGEPLVPLKLDVYVPDYMPSRGWIPVEVDPYTSDVLQAVRLQDRSPGLQARVWVRFIHTGAAFGFVGKVIATIATAASLFLVYTGFSLSYRRFLGKKRTVRS